MEIRRAFKSRDIDGMVDLLNQLFEIESDFTPNPELERKGLKMLLQSDLASVLIASEGVKVIGMCTAQIIVSTAAGGLKAQVEDVVVDKDYRRQGIGTKLLNAMEQEMKQKGVVRLALAVDKNNECATAFYNQGNWKEPCMKIMVKDIL